MQFHERFCQRLSFVLATQIQKIRSNGMLCAYFRDECCLIAIISNETCESLCQTFSRDLIKAIKIHGAVIFIE